MGYGVAMRTRFYRHMSAEERETCSPEQIAGRLQRVYPDDMGNQLSTETIYAALYVLPRGTLRSELLAALRRRQGPPASGARDRSRLRQRGGLNRRIL